MLELMGMVKTEIRATVLESERRQEEKWRQELTTLRQEWSDFREAANANATRCSASAAASTVATEPGLFLPTSVELKGWVDSWNRLEVRH